MKDYQVTNHNLQQFFSDIQEELGDSPVLIVTTQDGNIGKWGMARLWRQWMATTAKFMAAQGVTMPLMRKTDGSGYGSREFNPDDAHELFTCQWLGVDKDGNRLSWSRSGRDGKRPATKGERFLAMVKHEQWCVEKGISLLKPRDSEYAKLEQEQNK